MTPIRLPLRLARREVWRRPGRTALVAILVALPVAAMTMSVVLFRTDRVTPLEQWVRDRGQADAVLYADGPAEPVGGDGDAVVVPSTPEAGPKDTPPTLQELLDVLPAGARVVEVTSTYQRVGKIGGRRAFLELRDTPLQDPITVGIAKVVDGRAPADQSEIALSRAAARRLSAAVGETLELRGSDVPFQVVGVIERTGCLSCLAAVVTPGALGRIPSMGTMTERLVDLPDDLTAADRSALSAPLDGSLLLREDATRPGMSGSDDAREPVRWSLVLGALALTVAGIVISAAFAVGARRQLVTLGQLSASGVAPTTLRAALVLQGTVTGVIGAVLGLALAVVTLFVGHGAVERLLDQRVHGYAVRFLDVAVAVTIGIGAATVAALIPARSAARIPTLTALAGRRPLAPVPNRIVTGAVVAMVGGLGLLALAVVGSQSGSSGELWAYVAILGGVGELLGACALAPAIVARLEPLAGRLRGSWRLGARSLARHRSRTGAVVSAVAAAGALAIASGALLQGAQSREGRGADFPDDVVVTRHLTYQDATGAERSAPPSAEVRAAIAAALDGATEVTLQLAAPAMNVGSDPSQLHGWEYQLSERSPGVYFGSVGALVADSAVLDLLRASTTLRGALADPGIVVLSEDGQAGTVEVALPDGRSAAARVVPSQHTLGYEVNILISPKRAADLGLPVVPAATAFHAERPLTGDQRDAAMEAPLDVAEGPMTDGFTEVRVYSPLSGPSLFALEIILSALALVFSVFVVGVSLALAAAESRDERDVLAIAGAPPKMVARSAGARAWILAGIGGAMAIPVGFLPVIVFSKAGREDGWPGDFPLGFPWRTAAILLVAVPLCAAMAAWAASATAQRLRPVRVSTATFE